MKIAVLLCATLALARSPAFASVYGLDLTVHACPGNPGSSADAGILDCAGGQMVTLLATFVPQDPVTDLNGIDAVFGITVAGDIASQATFWDFATNAAGVSVEAFRPSSGCAAPAYADTWQATNSGCSAAGVYPVYARSDYSRVVATAFRAPAMVAAAGQRLFGLVLRIDTGTSIEHSGNAARLGCTRPASIVLEQVMVRGAGGSSAALVTPAYAGSTVMLNGGTTPVAARATTWGRLKSLYR